MEQLAGDGLRACSRSSDNSDGMPFSTHDRDNDKSSRNCAQINSAGWWFNDCDCANLNRPHNNNGYMKRWDGFSSSLKCSEMKLRSRD